MENKEYAKGSFNFYKSVLGFFFNLYYHPKVVNKEYIPEDGPIIVVGNHIHLFDQCAPILSTKRMIHYMAKKEHLTGKFGFFFKAAGCISVDRSIHDENAKYLAINKILDNGYALGIFPEGTRNSVACKKEYLDKLYKYYENEISFKKFKKIMKKNMVRVSQIDYLDNLLKLKKINKKDYKESILDPNTYLHTLVDNKIISKEEYEDTLLLPLKYGAVSMASKTGSTIVPFVTTGKYTFRSKDLTITFLKPFKVKKDDNLESKNNYLRHIMIKELSKRN